VVASAVEGVAAAVAGRVVSVDRGKDNDE